MKTKRPMRENLRVVRAQNAAYRRMLTTLTQAVESWATTTTPAKPYLPVAGVPIYGDAPPFVSGWGVNRGGGSTTQLLDAAGVVWEVCTETTRVNGVYVVLDRWVEPVELPRKPAGTYQALLTKAATRAPVPVVEVVEDLTKPLEASVAAALADHVRQDPFGLKDRVKGRKPKAPIVEPPPEAA